ncbi:MAG: hypothetical protein WD066_16890 [Planctomycetaceae bacterium]
MFRLAVAWCALILPTVMIDAAADDAVDEFRVKRADVFEFAREPALEIDGDDVTISFAVKAACDVTVAIEDPQGKVVRHLACGVLGANPPAPFAKDSLEQTLVWDGKDDRGRYIDDRRDHVVRVSLGLKPAFERSLLWEPRRRLGSWMGGNSFVNTPAPLIQAAEDGIYVFEGRGIDQLRVFDRDGEYVRTVYPFPADKIDGVVGVARQAYPQDGADLPHKGGFLQSTLLTSGATGQKNDRERAMYGAAATAMAVRDGRVALTLDRLNRLATEGSTGGLPLTGPNVTIEAGLERHSKEVEHVAPTRLALSPDAEWLYLASYQYRIHYDRHIVNDSLAGVARMRFDGDEPPEPFLGSLEVGGATGSKPGELQHATSVDVDDAGRVYVSDFMNDRIQVFSPDGEFLKAIATFKPVIVRVHRRTGEVFAFSWTLHNQGGLGRTEETRKIVVPPRLRTYGPFDDPQPRATYPLPFDEDSGRGYRETFHGNQVWAGMEFNAELDSWSDPPRIWTVAGKPLRGPSAREHIRIYELDEASGTLPANGELRLVRDFADDVEKSIGKFVQPQYWRQRLYVNPATGLLYVAEQHTAAREKAFRELIEVDPNTGRARVVQLPFDAEDLAFGPDGSIYLRERIAVARYEFPSFREIPWDYGEQMRNVTCDSSQTRRTADLLSGLPIYTGTGWHTGGLAVSVTGHLAVSCYVTKGDVPAPVDTRTDEDFLDRGTTDRPNSEEGERKLRGRVFIPRFFPGRTYFGEIHIFDEHGKPVHTDVAPGVTDIYGLGIDRDDSVAVLAAPTRIIDGERYFNEMAGTLVKFRPGKGRMITDKPSVHIPIPITDPNSLGRDPDVRKGSRNYWIEGADWKYGGVGFCGKNANYAGGGCSCWNTRFAMDYFGRSFAPEIDRYRVAVLDSAGNLVLRVGQYGNVDDGMPLASGRREPAGDHRGADAPRSPMRSIGGDEVGLFHAPYVATETDQRLFIADPGNQRIASVRLDYHDERTLPLRDVP